MLRLLTIFGSIVVVLATASVSKVHADDGFDFFEAKIRPVLVQECYECHAADSKQVHGGLLLDHKLGLLKGGDSGASVVPGDIDASLLISALRHEDFEMPPKGRLSDEVIADFVRWIEMGAPDPRTEEKTKASQAMTLTEAKDYWAFKPVAAVEVPSVRQSDWPKNAIDHFVLAKLEAAGLKPVRESTRREWIRRATFDLIGLPPTGEEIDTFLADESSEAYEVVIDRLLDSPHYGERWGRYWLDVARYAEDQAHTFGVRPNSNGYRYRDWVIEAFNRDMPYEQFVKLQIAADLMDLSEEDRLRHLPALGFFGLGAQYYKNSDAEKAKADELDDRVDTLTRGFLGLTVSCARCHDHKYDPIPTQDYYSLAGVFQSCRLTDEPLVPDDKVKAYRKAEQEAKEANEALSKFIASEKQSARESQASRVIDYILAVTEFTRSQASGTPRTVDQIAAQRSLSPVILKRWIDDYRGKRNYRHEALAPWYEVLDRIASQSKPRKNDESAADTEAPVNAVDDWEGQVAELAKRVQDDLVLALDIRAGRHKVPDVKGAESNEPITFEPGKPRYSSPVVTKLSRTVEVDADVSGAAELYLVITDAGDGKSCDHSDWIQPQLIGPNGPIKLTDLKWKAVHSGFGDVKVNRNHSGAALRVGGVQFDEGIGAHAPCVVVYDLPEGVTRFKSLVGLDNSGTDQGACGEQASVQFRVYTERPNDFDLIMSGEVKADQGVLSKPQADLLTMFLSDKGLFAVNDDQLEQVLAPEQRSELITLREQARLAGEAKGDALPVAHVIAEANPSDMQVFVRGNPARKGELAPRRFLKVIAGEEPTPFSKGSGRLELAEAIASADNPLTARVMVNRIWQQHFGRGIVATSSNFGTLGERPTHPELLDHLAKRFVEQGWSIKQLHREIMLSATYRLSSDHDAGNAEVDGDNRLLWRMNRRRLDVEAWRDSLLAVSGKLNRDLAGPSLDLDDDGNVRRTVYAKVSRHELSPLLRLFDFPDANISSERRSETIVPQQQLFVMNSRFMIEQSKALAERMFADDNEPLEQQIKETYLLLYGRPATQDEVDMGVAFVQPRDGASSDRASRAAQYAQVLLGANEFAFID